ncbi:MAG TPA: ribonuclease domain-containing protein [Alphaproteobacteria bacterium]|nr:ribonuclease domain-containing protein [Alphaproteobacteria bacterium]
MHFIRGTKTGFLFALAILAALACVSPVEAQEVCGVGLEAEGPQDEALRQFALAHRIGHPDAFIAIVDTIYRTGRLPDCYLTKRVAASDGWREGDDLWAAAPGDAIGGDRFGNREGRLPPEYNGRYREADLDYAGGHRGAHRLVFVEGSRGDWLVWVTTDHYRHVYKVPSPH